MKRIELVMLFFLAFSCNPNSRNTLIVEKDNEELQTLYEVDQGDRQNEPIDRVLVSQRDSVRRERVYQLLDSNKANTSTDYYNAAMIFQHGNDTSHYAMAVKLMKKSLELDSTANKWLLAAAIDRYLTSKGEPQIYGTQYTRMNDGPWKLAEIDTTVITDDERKEYGVETLEEQREKVKILNQMKLSELFSEGKTIDEILTLINQENKDNPAYDISENGINNFGYYLMSQENNEEALRIFKLNTEMYPDGYNTYDSYGECLLKLGRNEEAIKAYRKSLELNPDNKNAEEKISRIE